MGLVKKLRPLTVFLALEFCSSLIFSLVFTVNMVYQVTVVGLTPLQLVLVGTTLEATVFIFEVPTGLLADVKSRRLSVIIGYFLIGLGFVLEGSIPQFWAVLLAQVVWGLGYTFTSGATQAWIVDEIGEERAGEAFLRGAQAAPIGGLLAIPISVLAGLGNVARPVVLGGLLHMGLALFLAAAMREEGFKPTPAGERSNWQMMGQTLGEASRLARRQPVLLTLLGIGFFYGLYSEGLDRLWTAHLLENFTLPWAQTVEPVVWFGVIQAVEMVASLGATELARRRVNTGRVSSVGRFLMVAAGGIVGALAGFGLVQRFWAAVLLYWLIGALRSVSYPLYATWFNRRIDDPQVRATMFSVSSQVDAIGQIGGGPAVGLVGNRSIRAALVTCAVILAPVLPLYRAAMRRGEVSEPDEKGGGLDGEHEGSLG